MKTAQLIQRDEDEETVIFDTDIGNGPKTKHEKKIEEILAGLNTATENAYIALYRQNGTGKESLTFLSKFPADKFEGYEDILQYLAEKHCQNGPGDFRIHVRVNGKLAANNLVSVEPPAREVVDTKGNSDAALVAVLQQMEKQNQMIAGLYQQITAQKTAPSQSRREMLDEMLVYKQLFAPTSGAGNGGIGQIHETISFLKEIGVTVGGIAEEKEEGFGDILKNALPLLQTAIQGSHQPQPQPQPQPRPNQQPGNDNMMKMQLKMAVDFAVKSADAGKTPEDFAESVVEFLGEETATKLASDKNLLPILGQYNPRATIHAVWFADVFEHVKGIMGLPSRFAEMYSDPETAVQGEIIEPISTNGD